MIIHIEIQSSYYHKPQVQGVNLYHIMAESDVDALVKEERWSEATPAIVPLQSSLGGGLHGLCFVVSSLHLWTSKNKILEWF
jgi:hypothetical protein